MKKSKFKLISFMLVLAFALMVPAVASFGETEIRYLGEGLYTSDNDTIYYDYKEVSGYTISTKVPGFNNCDPTRNNGCSPIAGTIICGYFDRWYGELVPDYNPGRAFGSKYIYYSTRNNTQIQSVYNRLYDLMGTNVGAPGTNSRKFESGLKQYVQEKGKQLSIQNIGSGLNVDIGVLDDLLRDGQIGVMYCSTYNFITALVDDGNKVKLTKLNSVNAHMIVVYGYTTYKYFKDGKNFRTDTYIEVVSTTNEPAYYKVKLYDDIQLDGFVMVNIN